MRMMIVAACIGLGACGQNSADMARNDAAPADAAATVSPSGASSAGTASAMASGMPKVTKAQVAKLKEGMRYDEVKAILGRDGEKGTAEHGTESISWVNNDGSSLQTMFKEGKLAMFTDFGM